MFVLSAFAGGMASGLAGFAMGVLMSGVWLHFLQPDQVVALIVGYGLVAQGYGVWKLRRTLDWRRIAPFLAGAALGVPVGTALLTQVDPALVRTAVAVLLVMYGVYGLARPVLRVTCESRAVEAAVGAASGVVGGLAGLTGVTMAIWCQLRGWTSDVQRAVFQPVNLAIIIMTSASLAVSGAVTRPTLELFAVGLPFVLAGLWTGFRLYGKLNDSAFRRLLLFFVLGSGAALLF